MSDAFDSAAIRAAMKAVGERRPKSITLPGVGKLYRRELSVGDVDEARELRAELADKHPGLSKRRLAIAIGLAQVLCGPDGVPIFDPANAEDIALLAKVPYEAVRNVTAGDDEGDEKNA